MEAKIKYIYSSIVALIFIFLAIQVFSLRGHPGYDLGYINYYSTLLGGGAVIVLIFGIVMPRLKTNLGWEWLNFGDPYDMEEYLPLGDEETPIWLKALPHIAIGIFIIMMVINVPAVSRGFYNLPVIGSLSQGFTENYFISVPVGFAEDFIYLFLLPRIFLSILLGVLTTVNVEITKLKFTGLAVIVCLITSAGYGALVPGFASTHEVAFKDDLPSYQYVFGMGFAQSFAYQITGMFLPIGHPANNFIVNSNYQGTVVGSVATAGG